MNENANPLDYVLKCTEQGIVPKLFTVQNAKDEVKKLRQELDRLNKLFDNPIAWARINERGDVYGLRYTNNPYIDQTTVLPLYSDIEGYKALYGEKTLPSSSSKSES